MHLSPQTFNMDLFHLFSSKEVLIKKLNLQPASIFFDFFVEFSLFISNLLPFRTENVYRKDSYASQRNSARLCFWTGLKTLSRLCIHPLGNSEKFFKNILVTPMKSGSSVNRKKIRRICLIVLVVLFDYATFSFWSRFVSVIHGKNVLGVPAVQSASH